GDQIDERWIVNGHAERGIASDIAMVQREPGESAADERVQRALQAVRVIPHRVLIARPKRRGVAGALRKTRAHEEEELALAFKFDDDLVVQPRPELRVDIMKLGRVAIRERRVEGKRLAEIRHPARK